MSSDKVIQARADYFSRALEIARARYDRVYALLREGSVELVELENAELEVLRATVEWEDFKERNPNFTGGTDG